MTTASYRQPFFHPAGCDPFSCTAWTDLAGGGRHSFVPDRVWSSDPHDPPCSGLARPLPRGGMPVDVLPDASAGVAAAGFGRGARPAAVTALSVAGWKTVARRMGWRASVLPSAPAQRLPGRAFAARAAVTQT